MTTFPQILPKVKGDRPLLSYGSIEMAIPINGLERIFSKPIIISLKLVINC